MEKILNINPLALSLIATTFTYLMNLLGACTVLFFKEVSKKITDCFLSFGAGVMISASYFSLLNPAIETAEELNMLSWVVVSIGFLFGALFIVGADLFLNKIITKQGSVSNRNILMFSAITLHNIPEGMAIGVAFASLFANKITLKLKVSITLSR